MSESKPLNEWMKDWEALQRQYLTAWSDLSAKTPSAAMPGAGPFTGMPGAMPFAGMPGAGAAGTPSWHEGLEQWSRMFAGASQQSEAAERMLTSAKSYIAMIQSMFGAAAAQHGGFGSVGGGSAPANPAQPWLDSLRNGFGAPGGFGMPAGFSMPGMDMGQANNPFVKAIRDIVGQGAKGFGEMPAAFAPFVQQLRQEGLSWLKVPAFGVGREHQEHYQKTALAFVEYQQALHNYNQLMQMASQRGFELFESKLAERSEPGRAIDSLRALYDLWVDAAEEAYAEIALSDEFAKVYGELANAQMRARAQIQAEVERVSTDLGMPTRSELNSVHKRLHDLRRELRADKEARADTRELDAELTALRSQIKDFGQAVTRARASAVAEVPKPAPAQSKPQTQSLPRPRSRVRARVAPRAPAPVVKPRPIAASSGKSAGKEKNTFGDAIAAMRRRVGKSGKLKAVGAGVAKPAKLGKSERVQKKSAKRSK